MICMRSNHYIFMIQRLGQRSWKSMTEIDAWLATLTPEQRAKAKAELPLTASRNAWSDDEDPNLNKGHYYRKNGEAGSTEPDEDEYEDPRLNIIPGFANGSGDNEGLKEGKIDNSYFGVKAGNPIPTSENLEGEVKTNILGKVDRLRTIRNGIFGSRIYICSKCD